MFEFRSCHTHTHVSLRCTNSREIDGHVKGERRIRRLGLDRYLSAFSHFSVKANAKKNLTNSTRSLSSTHTQFAASWRDPRLNKFNLGVTPKAHIRLTRAKNTVFIASDRQYTPLHNRHRALLAEMKVYILYNRRTRREDQ